MPDQFSYYNVLIAIVLGLAIANLLAGLARLMHARKRVQLYWPSICWAVLLFVGIVQQWWADYDLRKFPNLGFTGFLSALFAPVVLSLLCSLVLPPSEGDESLDLRAWYFDNRRWFFALLASLMPLSYVFEYLAKGTFYKGHNESVFLIGFFLFAALGFLNDNPRVHLLLPVAGALFMGAYIGLLFMKLGGLG